MIVRNADLENIDMEKDGRMREFATVAAGFRLPRWEQIPTLGLYMDQVVTVIDRSLAPILDFSNEAFITAAMVNNYVKLGMVRKPERKKYSREHIVGLMVITVLKQSLAIGDIRLGMDAVLTAENAEQSYDNFCDYLERALQIVAQRVLSPDNPPQIDITGDPMIMMAVCSFATKIFAAKMLSIVREEQNNPSDASGRMEDS